MVLHEMANALRQQPGACTMPPPAGAGLDPGAAYAAPSDVLVDFSLSREDKIALLSQWRDDLALRSLARGEGMVGNDVGLGRRLASIHRALAQLRHA